MNILPQILDFSKKNLIISNITLKFQKELFSLFEKFIYHPTNFIPSTMISLQKINLFSNKVLMDLFKVINSNLR